MVFIIFLMIFQGAFCAKDACCADMEEVSVQKEKAKIPLAIQEKVMPGKSCDDETLLPRKTVLVQFQSREGLREVYWDIFGLMFNGAVSIEAVLERSLMYGTLGQSFVMREYAVERVLQDRHFGLYFCLKTGCCVRDKGLPLCIKHINKMRDGKSRQCQIVSAACDTTLALGEFRVLFGKGGLQFTPVGVRARSSSVPDGSPRFLQIKEELTPEFVAKVRTAAQLKLSRMKLATERVGSTVGVRFIDRFGASWEGSWNIQRYSNNGRTLMSFLYTCVLQGTFLGYSPDEKEEYYAFVNEWLDAVLRGAFSLSLTPTSVVTQVNRDPRACSEDMRALPPMSWCVVPQGEDLFRPKGRESFSLTFAGETIEGSPLFNGFRDKAGLSPRNYLWALDFDCLEPVPGKSYSSSKNMWWTHKDNLIASALDGVF